MGDKPTTDTVAVKVSLDPAILTAIDDERAEVKRKKKLKDLPSRASTLLKAAATGLGLKGYTPRGKGQPRKKPE